MGPILATKISLPTCSGHIHLEQLRCLAKMLGPRPCKVSLRSKNRLYQGLQNELLSEAREWAEAMVRLERFGAKALPTISGQPAPSPAVPENLMRHSDIRLTMNLYTHLDLADTSEAVAALAGV
jgi:hypothetical protein